MRTRAAAAYSADGAVELLIEAKGIDLALIAGEMDQLSSGGRVLLQPDARQIGVQEMRSARDVRDVRERVFGAIAVLAVIAAKSLRRMLDELEPVVRS